MFRPRARSAAARHASLVLSAGHAAHVASVIVSIGAPVSHDGSGPRTPLLDRAGAGVSRSD